jgi:hypothetical protein
MPMREWSALDGCEWYSVPQWFVQSKQDILVWSPILLEQLLVVPSYDEKGPGTIGRV